MADFVARSTGFRLEAVVILCGAFGLSVYDGWSYWPLLVALPLLILTWKRHEGRALIINDAGIRDSQNMVSAVPYAAIASVVDYEMRAMKSVAAFGLRLKQPETRSDYQTGAQGEYHSKLFDRVLAKIDHERPHIIVVSMGYDKSKSQIVAALKAHGVTIETVKV